MIGLHFDQIAYGMLASMGGLAFLYFPSGDVTRHKVVAMLLVIFGMCVSYVLGFLCQLAPVYLTEILAVVCIIITMASKAFFAGPPGNLFFLIIAFMGAYSHFSDSTQMLLNTGALALGSSLACILRLCFNVIQQENTANKDVFFLNSTHIEESILIGVFIFLALSIADLFYLTPAYWVGTSCLVVMQENSLASIWRKKFQRIIGTSVGVFISFYILKFFPVEKSTLSCIVFILAFAIAFCIKINYALACTFITVQVMVFSELINFKTETVQSILNSRLIDTIVGCVVGLLGGIFMHKFGFNAALVHKN